MVHFQTRDHIISWLDRHCPRKAIVRAINEGKTELLGGFSNIPPSRKSGWVIRITSSYGRVWLVAITENTAKTDFAIGLLKGVPWAHWCGDLMPGKLYRGDKPWLYQAIKEKINANMVDE